MLLRQVRAQPQGKPHGKPPPAPHAPSRPAAAAAATVLINTTRNRRPLPDPQAHEGHATIHHQSNATRQSPWTITWTDRCNRMGGGPFTTMSHRGTCVDPRYMCLDKVPAGRGSQSQTRRPPCCSAPPVACHCGDTIRFTPYTLTVGLGGSSDIRKLERLVRALPSPPPLRHRCRRH